LKGRGGDQQTSEQANALKGHGWDQQCSEQVDVLKGRRFNRAVNAPKDRGLYRLQKNSIQRRFSEALYQGTTSVVP
jgi:hypothetical protein